MFVAVHVMSLSPSGSMRHTLAEESAFRWIEWPIPYVPQVNLPEHRIGLAHPLQHGNCSNPKRDRQTDSPQSSQTERQAH
jgi:hypothetical protein